jgi:hypothetical protein
MQSSQTMSVPLFHSSHVHDRFATMAGRLAVFDGAHHVLCLQLTHLVKNANDSCVRRM